MAVSLDETPSAGGKTRKPRAKNAPPRGAASGTARRAARNSEIVYQDLRNAIINVTLPPGSPLAEKDLTENTASAERRFARRSCGWRKRTLSTFFPKSGTFVARIPVSELREAIVARKALEEVCVREATMKASKSQLMGLRAIVQREQELADKGDEQAFHEADNAFHSGIAAASGYPGIWNMIEKIRLQVERYRRLTLPQEGRMQLIVGEHAAVLEAIEKGDADAAVANMNNHLNKLQIDIGTFQDLWPDYFLFDKD